MEIKKVIISEKLDVFNNTWNLRIVGELNVQHIKLAKFQGHHSNSELTKSKLGWI